MLHDTRVSIRLTPGSHATQHPGVRYAEIRVSYNLSLHRKKKKPATNFYSIASIIKLNKPTFTPSKRSKWKVNTNYLSTNGHRRTVHGKK